VTKNVSSQKLNWTLDPGDEVLRVRLHDEYGGTRQGGISSSNTTPTVLLFTVPGHKVAETSLNWSHTNHGYVDRWEGTERKVYLYCGMGQDGDQDPLWSGNRAILNHAREGRDLRLFTPNSGKVQYVGRFYVDETQPYRLDKASDRHGRMRTVIQFRLKPYGPIADWF
jgi:hypothetical protein